MFSFMTFCDAVYLSLGTKLFTSILQRVIRFHGSCTQLTFGSCQRHHEYDIFWTRYAIRWTVNKVLERSVLPLVLSRIIIHFSEGIFRCQQVLSKQNHYWPSSNFIGLGFKHFEDPKHCVYTECLHRMNCSFWLTVVK